MKSSRRRAFSRCRERPSLGGRELPVARVVACLRSALTSIQGECLGSCAQPTLYCPPPSLTSTPVSLSFPKTRCPKETFVPRYRRRSLTTTKLLQHASVVPKMANPDAPKPQAPMDARPTSPSSADAGPITQAPVSPHTFLWSDNTTGKPRSCRLGTATNAPGPPTESRAPPRRPGAGAPAARRRHDYRFQLLPRALQLPRDMLLRGLHARDDGCPR